MANPTEILEIILQLWCLEPPGLVKRALISLSVHHSTLVQCIYELCLLSVIGHVCLPLEELLHEIVALRDFRIVLIAQLLLSVYLLDSLFVQ